MADLLNISDLRIQFRLNEGIVHAVNGVSFRVPEGKTVALVGESGSGKSVISQAIKGILPKAAAITGGHILFNDPHTRIRDTINESAPLQDLVNAIRGQAGSPRVRSRE